MATSLARPLPPATAARLVKVCGLLASDHAGESAAAAAAATRIIKEHDLTWEQVVRTGISAPPPPHRPIDWRTAATACLRRADLLSAWERGFVGNLMDFQRISVKQEALLARLYDRVCSAGGAP